jgi:hypothetical protein
VFFIHTCELPLVLFMPLSHPFSQIAPSTTCTDTMLATTTVCAVQDLLAKGSILPVMRATEQHNKPFLTQV